VKQQEGKKQEERGVDRNKDDRWTYKDITTITEREIRN
jgi:hypothetical protein